MKRFWGFLAASPRAVVVGALLCAAVGQATAATFVVTTTADSNDGACTLSLCSLRDAVIAANAAAGADVITLPAGTYTLTIAGTGEDAAATGDLDITGSLTINGAGAATTIVDGGALDRVFDVKSGTVVFNDITVRNGLPASGEDGGGIANAGTLTLNRVVVSGNHTSNGGNGAGIFNTNTVTISSSTFSGNVGGGGGNGGGIFNDNAMTVTGSVVSGNSAGPTGGNGAGIYNNDTMTVTDSTVSGNTGAGGGNGAGIYDNGLSLTMTGSTVSGNTTATGDGGGIYENGISLSATNSTISGNSAAAGGGLFNNGVGATLLNVTIASNTGGGINNNGLTVQFTSTIIANNGVNCTSTGSPFTDGGTNLQFPGITCGASITSADPLLQPLANNGGPTDTQALGAGSPAIDAGTEECPPTPPTDQRGVARPQGLACDIGAFELQASGPPPPPPPASLPIPTLSRWGLAALTVLIALFALGSARTRRR